MQRVVGDVLDLLQVGEDDLSGDRNELWDERSATVAGGRNWANTPEAELPDEGYLVLSDPELAVPVVDW